jgi:hypothetical protein
MSQTSLVPKRGTVLAARPGYWQRVYSRARDEANGAIKEHIGTSLAFGALVAGIAAACYYFAKGVDGLMEQILAAVISAIALGAASACLFIWKVSRTPPAMELEGLVAIAQRDEQLAEQARRLVAYEATIEELQHPAISIELALSHVAERLDLCKKSLIAALNVSVYDVMSLGLLASAHANARRDTIAVLRSVFKAPIVSEFSDLGVLQNLEFPTSWSEDHNHIRQKIAVELQRLGGIIERVISDPSSLSAYLVVQPKEVASALPPAVEGEDLPA